MTSCSIEADATGADCCRCDRCRVRRSLADIFGPNTSIYLKASTVDGERRRISTMSIPADEHRHPWPHRDGEAADRGTAAASSPSPSADRGASAAASKPLTLAVFWTAEWAARWPTAERFDPDANLLRLTDTLVEPLTPEQAAKAYGRYTDNGELHPDDRFARRICTLYEFVDPVCSAAADPPAWLTAMAARTDLPSTAPGFWPPSGTPMAVTRIAWVVRGGGQRDRVFRNGAWEAM